MFKHYIATPNNAKPRSVQDDSMSEKIQGSTSTLKSQSSLGTLDNISISETVSEFNTSSSIRYSISSLTKPDSRLNPFVKEGAFSQEDDYTSENSAQETQHLLKNRDRSLQDLEAFTILSLSSSNDYRTNSNSVSYVSDNQGSSWNNFTDLNESADFANANGQVISLSELNLKNTHSNTREGKDYRVSDISSLDSMQNQPRHIYRRRDFQLIFEYLKERGKARKSRDFTEMRDFNRGLTKEELYKLTKIKDIPSIFGDHRDLIFKISLGLSTEQVGPTSL